MNKSNIPAEDLIWSLDPLFKNHVEMKSYCLGQSIKFWEAKMNALSPEEWDQAEIQESLWDECARILEEEERA